MYIYCKACQKVYSAAVVHSKAVDVLVVENPITGKISEHIIDVDEWEERMCPIAQDHIVELVMDPEYISNYGIECDDTYEPNKFKEAGERFKKLFKKDMIGIFHYYSIDLNKLSADDLLFMSKVIQVGK